MKTKLIAIALLSMTAASVVLLPNYNNHQALANNATTIAPPNPSMPTQAAKKIEAVFVLDTTGSMGGLIQAAKEKIWSIASTMASAQSSPEIKIGLVAYRDRGDDYVTKTIDLSDDLDSMYAQLMDFKAGGGGDFPESVNQALYDAVHKISWGSQQDTYQVVFLVGDAPPHMDYQDDIKYPLSISAATKKGIIVNSIQCGEAADTMQLWQQIASLGSGNYFQVEQSGNAVAITTPYDKKLAELSADLDQTRLYYGDAEHKAHKKKKKQAADKMHARSSLESRARRATFNASKSGKANLWGKGELVDDVSSGRVNLSSIDSEKLPKIMQSMSPESQQQLISETANKRQELEVQIDKLAKDRAAYIKQEMSKSGGAKDSLDEQIYATVRAQANKKGLKYKADAAVH